MSKPVQRFSSVRPPSILSPPLLPRRPRVGSATSRQKGWAYLVLIFFVLTITTTGLKALESIAFQAQRDRELELLEIGREIREAIGRYYEVTPGALKLYPAKLDDLLKDERFIGIERHLRRLRPDPFTGVADWQSVLSPQGGIQGVVSRSLHEPIRRVGFEPSERNFGIAKSYSDWRFVYQPRTLSIPEAVNSQNAQRK
jgi:hypothetical protein